MKTYRYIAVLASAALLAFSCDKPDIPVIPSHPEENTGDKPSGQTGTDSPGTDNPGTDTPGGDTSGGTTGYGARDGVEYMFDGKTIPEVHITVSLSEWNKLLSYYDQDSNTKASVLCSVLYDKAGEKTEISDCSIRLRGNTSRVRPEGSGGQMHTSGSTDWHHCHFQVNFHKNVKDEAHELHGARKVVLKWFKDDPSYVREVYCYDLFRRAGVWTAPYSAYCRLYIKVEGDSREAYYGVYEMVEPIDDRYVKVRKDSYENKDGFLWKCRYGATLSHQDVTSGGRTGADLNDGREYLYELKTMPEQLTAAQAMLKDFTYKVKTLGGSEFHDWIASVCDVGLLLRTYAVNVTVGMWDDYWNNKNNYYIYFNSQDVNSYKFFFIPYDYDNTLGTTQNCGVQSDAGRQNPFNWGDSGASPLISKIISYDDYRTIYKNELLRLVNPANDLFLYSSSSARIKAWQDSVRPYVSNDTGEDMVIEDRPAPWSNHGEYRLLDQGSANWFTVRTQTITNYCK